MVFWGSLFARYLFACLTNVYGIKYYVCNLAHAIESIFLLGQYINQPGVAFSTKVTTDDNAITNAVDVYLNPR